jgi:hypothetical protein
VNENQYHSTIKPHYNFNEIKKTGSLLIRVPYERTVRTLQTQYTIASQSSIRIRNGRAANNRII